MLSPATVSKTAVEHHVHSAHLNGFNQVVIGSNGGGNGSAPLGPPPGLLPVSGTAVPTGNNNAQAMATVSPTVQKSRQHISFNNKNVESVSSVSMASPMPSVPMVKQTHPQDHVGWGGLSTAAMTSPQSRLGFSQVNNPLVRSPSAKDSGRLVDPKRLPQGRGIHHNVVENPLHKDNQNNNKKKPDEMAEPQKLQTAVMGGSPSLTPQLSAVPVFSMGAADPLALPGNGRKTPPATTGQRSPGNNGVRENLNNRRQKRLERNRESARLSRRRRKQYLEVLEEKVTVLSEEMDKGRREHVAKAIQSVRDARGARVSQISSELGIAAYLERPLGTVAMPRLSLRQFPTNLLEYHIRDLDRGLSLTGDELRIAATFQKEQLKSLALPSQTKFTLWLTLQNEPFFRGGRAASERLSAARIGERLLHSGNDRVNPANGMWPLLCNEIGLSYDQEDRFRNYQRTLLANHESWLHRHTASSLDRTLQAIYVAIARSINAAHQREQAMLSVLTLEQRVKYQAWANARSSSIAKVAKKLLLNQPRKEQNKGGRLNLSPDLHKAANLYILNHKLQTKIQRLPEAPTLVSGNSLKKLSRRPSFEALSASASSSSLDRVGSDSGLVSFPSTGSLKRSASEQSYDEMDSSVGDRSSVAAPVPAITPEAGQAAAATLVSSALGSVASIIPPPQRQDHAVTTTTMTATTAPSRQPQPLTKPQHFQPQQVQLSGQFMAIPQNQQSGQVVPQTISSSIIMGPLPDPTPVHNPAHKPTLMQVPGAAAPLVYPQPMVMPSQPTVPYGQVFALTPTQSAAHHAMAPLSAPPQPAAPSTMSALEPQQVTAMNKFSTAMAPSLPFSSSSTAPSTVSNTISSILPPHLNIVPEDGYLNNLTQNDDDLLMDLTEEDWAIGESFDMEVS